MRVAIIGRGTSAIIQACALLHAHKSRKDLSITIFYDPDRPPIAVGESSTPHLPFILEDALGVTADELVEAKVVSRKRGAAFVNWGAGIPFVHGFGDDSKHSIDGNSTLESYHFDTLVFNEYFTKKLQDRGVIYIAEKVESQREDGDVVFINDKEFDFVVNCTGWNYDNNLTVTPQFWTVNAGYLYRDTDFHVTDELTCSDLTVHKASPDGWEFNLPFPCDGVMKKGYLFNTDYISEEEVLKKMEDMGRTGGRLIKWKPRRSKHLIESKLTAGNGNRVFFVEPLQAYAVLLYIELAYFIAEYIYSKKTDKLKNTYNLKYRKLMISYEQELAFHYQYGSVFKDSKFWQDKTEEARRVMYYHPSASIMELDEIVKYNYELDKSTFWRVFMHSKEDLLYVHRWMTDQWGDEKPKIVW